MCAHEIQNEIEIIFLVSKKKTISAKTIRASQLESKSISYRKVSHAKKIVKKCINLFYFFFSLVSVKPYLYKLQDMTVTVLEEYPTTLSCYLLVGNEHDQNITWSWSFKNTALNATCLMSIFSNNTQSTLSFSKTDYSHKGVYTCKASNLYGSFERSISLRIKSDCLFIFANYPYNYV